MADQRNRAEENKYEEEIQREISQVCVRYNYDGIMYYY